MRTGLIIFTVLAISTAVRFPWVRKSPYDHAALQQQEGPAAQWFEQELDHFSSDDRTWQQRYYVNSTFYKPGGPIFLQVGGESAIGSYYVTLLEYVSYAETYGAMLVALEHRFYGVSMPLPNLSTSNLKYLSSDQALADLGHFIVSFKNSIGAPNAEVVTFGGSYPGNLAAWFRIKYPSVTVGAVASSAPVQATLDFYQYLDVVDRSLADVTGPKCNEQIALATTYLENLLSTGQLTKVERMFNTCTPFTNPLDLPTFMSGLMGNFMGTVQYDNEGSPITIQTLCNIMDNATEPIDGYIAVNNLMLYLYGESCTSVSYDSTLDVLEFTNATWFDETEGARSWTYQTCAEFGYFQTTDSPNQPFGNMVPLRYYTQLCNDLGWNFTTRVNETNEKYGGNNPTGSTEILFVNGSLDPWHILSVTETSEYEIKAILINGTAHCANMLPASPMDPPGLAKAQKEIRKHIGTYLNN